MTGFLMEKTTKIETEYTNHRLQICKNRQMRSKKALNEIAIITKTTKIAKFYKAIEEK